MSEDAAVLPAENGPGRGPKAHPQATPVGARSLGSSAAFRRQGRRPGRRQLAQGTEVLRGVSCLRRELVSVREHQYQAPWGCGQRAKDCGRCSEPEERGRAHKRLGPAHDDIAGLPYLSPAGCTGEVRSQDGWIVR
jgi:hypothetical protein